MPTWKLGLIPEYPLTCKQKTYYPRKSRDTPMVGVMLKIKCAVQLCSCELKENWVADILLSNQSIEGED